jgi:hypothetical protein
LLFGCPEWRFSRHALHLRFGADSESDHHPLVN